MNIFAYCTLEDLINRRNFLNELIGNTKNQYKNEFSITPPGKSTYLLTQIRQSVLYYYRELDKIESRIENKQYVLDRQQKTYIRTYEL